MTRTIQILRGTEAQNDAFTGAIGELTMDTTNNEIRIHDGSTAGGHKIGGYHPDLFDWKWADHQLDDVKWLRADTFSWQSGAVYESAYQHLVDDIDGKTAQTETISGITISFYLANDGHKITTDESAVAQIYAATGVAWYYILDTVNERFKLPRGKHSKYSETNQVTTTDTNYTAGSTPMRLGTVGTSTAINRGSANPIATYGDNGIGTNAAGGSWGSQHEKLAPINLIINNEQDTHQYKYLYFYVGSFTQTALENTAGLNAELFNGKADVSTVAHVVTEFQAPTAANNYTWYRKYADGWVEQGGFQSSGGSGNHTITLPVEMDSTNYTPQVTRMAGASTTGSVNIFAREPTLTTQFTYYSSDNTGAVWRVEGMAA